MQNFEEKEYISLLIDDIRSALDNDLYFVALASALTIPDILSIIEYGFSSSDNYAKWVDKYVRNELGYTYGEWLQKVENISSKDDESYEGNAITTDIKDKNGNDVTDINEKIKYCKSPTTMCGLNCYQLRCSLLHDGTNEIKAGSKSSKSRQYLFIHECVLELTKDESSTGIRNGGDLKLVRLSDGSPAWKSEKFCYINVRELCNDIIRAAENYIKDKSVYDKLTKIKVNNGGGKVSSFMGSESCTEHYRLLRDMSKRINNK